MAIVPSDVTDKIMARLPNAGNTDQNNDAKSYINILVEEILNEITTNGVVTGTDSNGDTLSNGVISWKLLDLW